MKNSGFMSNNNSGNYNRKRIFAYRMCRRKKRESLRSKVDEIVEHQSKNESRKFCKQVKEYTQEFKPRINACKDANGKICIDREDVLRRWEEYFINILCAGSSGSDGTLETVHMAEEEDLETSSEEGYTCNKVLKKS